MNHCYGPRCARTIVATAAIISCHSHEAECYHTAATLPAKCAHVPTAENDDIPSPRGNDNIWKPRAHGEDG